MGWAVCYRLRNDTVGQDRSLLLDVYEDLAAVRPTWLTAETFVGDDGHSMIFLLSTDQQRRVSELAGLSVYWGELAERCVIRPRDYVIRRATIDKLPFTKIAYWNPYRQTWGLPPRATPGDR